MLAKIISERLNISLHQVEGTLQLLDSGATIPFIARYRKEATGSLDEVAIAAIKEQYDKLKELEARKLTVLSTIEEQGKLSPELKKRIEQCFDAVELEDIYLPYKPKRRTRATVARERGLEPLSDAIFAQNERNIIGLAQRFVKDEVTTVDDALAGACDIIAEKVSESEQARNCVRRVFGREGVVSSKVVKGKDEEGVKYSDYFDMTTSVRNISSHRFLAMKRGEEEGVLRIGVDTELQPVLEKLNRQFIKPLSTTRTLMENAVADGYKRLLQPSIENEVLASIKERADDEAIVIFAENLRQLLLSSPLGQKRVIAIDPGFRTGCKVVVLDAQGNLLYHTAIYPHPPQRELAVSAEKIHELVEKFRIEAFAIGNGTAGRETEQFIRLLDFANVPIYVVNEDGASIYSASAVAREEFPDYDITVRGAVSIGRRLIDPLSELVKIEPRSIGVGQYQHSVDQKKLKGKLDTVVESCVNKVGVNLNTATKQILTYISGLGPSLAESIVSYRAENDNFNTRKDLLKVPRLGAKAFEQAAGFLRVLNGKNPLDSTAVHPESYGIVEKMAKDLHVSIADFIADATLRKQVTPQQYVTETAGLPTVMDILEALDKRGLDPREQAKAFAFDEHVHEVADLRVGMELPGIITNMTAFGAFVNIGVHQDGLVHVSQMADKFVKSPAEVVHLGQQVLVTVIGIDTARNRISLSMKKAKNSR